MQSLVSTQTVKRAVFFFPLLPIETLSVFVRQSLRSGVCPHSPELEFDETGSVLQCVTLLAVFIYFLPYPGFFLKILDILENLIKFARKTSGLQKIPGSEHLENFLYPGIKKNPLWNQNP